MRMRVRIRTNRKYKKDFIIDADRRPLKDLAKIIKERGWAYSIGGTRILYEEMLSMRVINEKTQGTKF